MRDLMNNVHLARALSPVSVADNTAQVSEIVDLRGFGSCFFAISIGGVADADATFAVLLEEGDAANLSDAAAVADADLIGTEALAGFKFDDDNKVRKLGYAGGRRYLRLTITPAGNAGAALLSAVAVLGHPAVAPTPNPPI